MTQSRPNINQAERWGNANVLRVLAENCSTRRLIETSLQGLVRSLKHLALCSNDPQETVIVRALAQAVEDERIVIPALSFGTRRLFTQDTWRDEIQFIAQIAPPLRSRILEVFKTCTGSGQSDSLDTLCVRGHTQLIQRIAAALSVEEPLYYRSGYFRRTGRSPKSLEQRACQATKLSAETNAQHLMGDVFLLSYLQPAGDALVCANLEAIERSMKLLPLHESALRRVVSKAALPLGLYYVIHQQLPPLVACAVVANSANDSACLPSYASEITQLVQASTHLATASSTTTG